MAQGLGCRAAGGTTLRDYSITFATICAGIFEVAEAENVVGQPTGFGPE